MGNFQKAAYLKCYRHTFSENNNNNIAPRECNWILGGEKKFYMLQWFVVFQRASAYKQISSISVVLTIHRVYVETCLKRLINEGRGSNEEKVDRPFVAFW